MIRLYFLCLLIALETAKYDKGQGHLMIVPLFTEVDIYKQSPCTSKWLKKYKQMKPIFHTTEASYDLYHCLEPQQFLYLVKSETDLTLTVTPEGGVIGDKLILTCGITLVTTNHAINCNLKILDSSKVQLAETIEGIEPMKLKNIQVNVSSFELFETGYQIVYCQGFFEMSYDDATGRHTKSTNATIQTYIVPTNVTPDMTEVTVGGSVICQSFADPPATHVWSCSGDGWSTNGALLTLNALGELNCSCSAISVLQGVSYEITWHGTIRVIGVGSCSSTRIPQLYIAILFLASNQL